MHGCRKLRYRNETAGIQRRITTRLPFLHYALRIGHIRNRQRNRPAAPCDRSDRSGACRHIILILHIGGRRDIGRIIRRGRRRADRRPGKTRRGQRRRSGNVRYGKDDRPAASCDRNHRSGACRHIALVLHERRRRNLGRIIRRDRSVHGDTAAAALRQHDRGSGRAPGRDGENIAARADRQMARRSHISSRRHRGTGCDIGSSRHHSIGRQAGPGRDIVGGIDRRQTA